MPRPTAVARCDEIGEASGDLLSWVAPATPFRERAGGSVDGPSGDGSDRGRQKDAFRCVRGCDSVRPRGGRMSRLAVVAIVSAFAILEFPTRVWGLVIPVTSTADAPDVMPGDGACATSTGDCTLRAAIDEVAALAVPPASVTIAVPAGHYGI